MEIKENTDTIYNRSETRLLIPKIDIVFHSLFRKHKEELTSNFVSSLLQQKVKIINMDKDRNLIKKYPEEKLGILDLRTELEDGVICNIEIQLANEGNIVERILYYWSRAFNEQLKEAHNYQELNKTIVILIADFELKEMRKIEELGSRWLIMLDGEEKRILTEKLEIRIIEIPKAKRILKKEEDNEIAQWMMFLDNPNSMEVSKIMRENEEIKEAVDELEEISQDEELRRIAFLKEKYKHDEAQAKYFYKKTGLEEGIKEGKKEMIITMLKNNISKEQISSMTGISMKEIEELLQIG